MGAVVPIHDPENYKSAIKRIRYLWEKDLVTWSEHAKERMEERGFDMLDVQYVIRYGEIIEHCMIKNRWRYVIKGKTVDGRLLKCVIAVVGTLMVVTVIP